MDFPGSCLLVSEMEKWTRDVRFWPGKIGFGGRSEWNASGNDSQVRGRPGLHCRASCVGCVHTVPYPLSMGGLREQAQFTIVPLNFSFPTPSINPAMSEDGRVVASTENLMHDCPRSHLPQFDATAYCLLLAVSCSSLICLACLPLESACH